MQVSAPKYVTGWILTGLVGIFMIGVSGISKFFDFPDKEKMMDRMGISLTLLPSIAILEIVIAILYLIPRTAFLGAVLMTGYLGGAVFAHLRIGEAWYFPIVVGAIAWLGLALRHPILFKLFLQGHAASQSPLPPNA